MRSRAAAALVPAMLAAPVALGVGPPASADAPSSASPSATTTAPVPTYIPPPHLPPLAFRTATLVRADRTIEIRLSAVSQVGVRVVVSRGTVRLGAARAGLERGTSAVPVPIGPKGIRPLRKGLHVNVAIYYGPADPVRARPALLIGQSADAPPITA
ncbi:MAG TPA: hypothetical protein VGO71_04635 [Baekduia sp.]|nr:hypothetical protein [Baekduia sp.]